MKMTKTPYFLLFTRIRYEYITIILYGIGNHEAAAVAGVGGVSKLQCKELHDTCTARGYSYCCSLSEDADDIYMIAAPLL